MIPTEMQKQCSARMELINSMMANGSITTPIEYLETPVLLVLNMSDDVLAYERNKLMRTRKRYITFGLNGRVYVLPRKTAIAVVVNEINERKLMIAKVKSQ